jgi:hypothetical protein
MNLIERVKQIKELWTMLVPFCQPPEPRQFALWANKFDDSIIERAFWRASKKFNPQKVQVPDTDAVHRYVTSVMVNEAKERNCNAISN